MRPHLARTSQALAIAALLAVTPALTRAGVVNLRWDACWGDGGVTNNAFACDTNVGTSKLVASFIPPLALHDVTDLEARIDFMFAGGSVPNWWRFRTAGSCRATSLSLVTVPPAAAAACSDWSSSQAFGLLLAYSVDAFSPGRASLNVITALAPNQATDLAGGQEYFAFSVVMNNQKTVGAGACEGCDVGVCLGLQYIEVNSGFAGTIATLNPPFNSQDWIATWQGGLSGSPTTRCQASTAARNVTWGSVKSLYRY